LLADLREADVAAVIAFGDRSLRSQLREANKKEVRYAVIIGEEEMRQGRAAIRDMSDGNQELVPMADLIAWLKRNL
jgi:histidyl-tRNA synthetase